MPSDPLSCVPGFPGPWRISAWARSRSLRATAGSNRPRCRRTGQGSDSSTRCRQNRAALDDAQLVGLNAVLAQVAGGEQAGKAAADDDYLEVAGDRLARSIGRRPGIGIVTFGELTFEVDVFGAVLDLEPRSRSSAYFARSASRSRDISDKPIASHSLSAMDGTSTGRSASDRKRGQRPVPVHYGDHRRDRRDGE